MGKIKNYRKTIIAAIPTLTYLDDRPVFAEDRRHAEAFAKGGIEAEREEREKIKIEKREKDDRNHKAFRDMMEKARAEKRAAEEKARKERGEPEPAEVPKSDDEKHEEKLAELEKEKEGEQKKGKFKGAFSINKNDRIADADRSGATVEEIKDDEDDDQEDEAPPELEQVTAEELQNERENMSEKEKE